jgi:hypothetical protein
MAAGRIMPPLEEILQRQGEQFMPQIPEGEELLQQYLAQQYGATGQMPSQPPATDMENAEQYGAFGPQGDPFNAPEYGATENMPTPPMSPGEAGPIDVTYEEFMSMPPEMQQGVFGQLSPEKQQEFQQRAATEPVGDDYEGGPSADEIFQEGYDEAASDPMRNQELRNQIEMTQQAGNVYQGMVDDVARGNDMLQGQLDKFNKNTPTNPYTGEFLPDFDPTQLAPRPGQRADQTMARIASGVHPMVAGANRGVKDASAGGRVREHSLGKTGIVDDPTSPHHGAEYNMAKHIYDPVTKRVVPRTNQHDLSGGGGSGSNEAPARVTEAQLEAVRKATGNKPQPPPRHSIQRPMPAGIDPIDFPSLDPADESSPTFTPPPPSTAIPSIQPHDPSLGNMGANQKKGADALIAQVKKGNIDYGQVMGDPHVTDIVKSHLAQEDAKSGGQLSQRRRQTQDDFMGSMAGMINHYTPGYSGNSMMSRLANRNA